VSNQGFSSNQDLTPTKGLSQSGFNSNQGFNPNQGFSPNQGQNPIKDIAPIQGSIRVSHFLEPGIYVRTRASVTPLSIQQQPTSSFGQGPQHHHIHLTLIRHHSRIQDLNMQASSRAVQTPRAHGTG